MTVSAVSQQLKALESLTEAPLLEKRGRQLVVTSIGAALAGRLAKPFSDIDDAIADVRGARATLTISAHDTFTAHWLLPRLPRFDALCPDVDVRLAATSRIVDLERERVDCAIRLGPGGWPDVGTRLLTRQELAPLVRVDRLDAMPRTRILRDNDSDAWRHWADLPAFDRDLTVTSRDLVINAVLSGSGIGLCDVVILADRIIAGELVAVGPSRQSDWQYHVVLPNGHHRIRPAEQFVDWLAAEFAHTSAELAKFL